MCGKQTVSVSKLVILYILNLGKTTEPCTTSLGQVVSYYYVLYCNVRSQIVRALFKANVRT